jgi:DNA-binding HxlR family transcriptional regulator
MDFSTVHCSIARTFAVLSDPWSALIVRDLAVGIHRFDELVGDLGISRKILTARLATLLEHEIVERQPYQQNPPRYDYVLTEQGRELMPILYAAMSWGDRWRDGNAGPPALLRHRDHTAAAVVVCSECGEPMTLDDTVGQHGPGGRRARGTGLIGSHLHGPVPG